MNIRLVISNYINQDGKSKVVFDCSEGTYRKKLDTGVKINKIVQKGARIKEGELENFSIEKKILLNKLFDKAKSAIRKYKNLGWEHFELESFLKEHVVRCQLLKKRVNWCSDLKCQYQLCHLLYAWCLCHLL